MKTLPASITENERETLEALQQELDDREDVKNEYNRFNASLSGFNTYLIHRYKINPEEDLIAKDGTIKRGVKKQMTPEERRADRERRREQRKASRGQ